MSDQSTWFGRLDGLIRRRGQGEVKVLATVLGVDASQVSHFRQGRRLPDVNEVKAICEHYKVPADWLLGTPHSKAPQWLADEKLLSLEEHLVQAQELIRDEALAARGRALADFAPGKVSKRPRVAAGKGGTAR